MAVNCENHLIMEKQITVLIADDNNLMRETLRILIAAADKMTLSGEAKNGEEAIALAEALTPDIILMDITMSPVNGFEATRKILKKNSSIKIIGFSMHREAAYCRNLLRLGAKGYIIKGCSHHEIVAAIKEVAAGGKYIDKGISGTI